MNEFDMVSPLDYRYYAVDNQLRARLQPYVSEEAQVQYCLRVECALVRSLAMLGLAPLEVASDVDRAVKDIRADEVYEEEKRTRHNVRALVNCIARRVGEETKPYVHLFTTSCDITDTATALRFKELFRDVIEPDAIELGEVIASTAEREADTVQIGRTHGKHAEPITFGHALALYLDRLGQRIQQMEAARKNLRGKLSGAVGCYSSMSLAFPDDPTVVETKALALLGIEPAQNRMCSQIVQPEYVTDLVHATVSTFSILAQIADDVRQLSRSEIEEVYERYAEDQVGSSTMPHKRNPRSFENVKSLWKEFMPRMTTLYMDQISEHQRDLTNSASSRFVSELFTAFDYSVTRMTGALRELEVDREAMLSNLKRSENYIIAEPLYILLALSGYSKAYDAARRLVNQARGTRQPLIELVMHDRDVAPYFDRLSRSQKEVLADPRKYTGAASALTYRTCSSWRSAFRELLTSLSNERHAKFDLMKATK
ncbi:MAG: adenylosuccinate lyase [Chloroflexi bacterium]|nr:adenylosuccinate lyase [Chloroflexota bacterium]